MGKLGEDALSDAKLGEAATTGNITASGTATGSGNVVGTATAHITASATATGSGTVTGTPTLGFTASGTATGSGNVIGDTLTVAGVPSQGWHVVVIHPETGRRITASVLDRDPAILPSLGTLPEIRIPVRKNDAWLDEALEDDPPMLAWLDGQRLPIDELREVEDMPDHTLLVGVGATELEDRLKKEYQSKRRHEAASEIASNQTNYAADIDTPVVETLTGQVQQDATTDGEFQTHFSFEDTDPVAIRNDNIELLQSAHHIEGESFSLTSTNSDGDSSEGQFETLATDADDTQSVNIDYTIPASDARLAYRVRNPNDPDSDMAFEGYGFDILVDGSVVESFVDNWTQSDGDYDWVHSDIGSDVSGNTTVEIDGNPTGGERTDFDLVVVYDDRFSYNFPTTVDGDNHLAGPELYPDQFNVVSADSQTAFSFVAGEATVSMNDTSGNQRLQISNDRGSNYVPDDGTEDNTTTVDEDFADGDTYERARIRLSRFGSRTSATPTSGFNGQVINDYTLEADINLELLLTDYKEDQTIISHLNEIATDTEFLWSANLDSAGDYQVSWTQPGQRTASEDPDIGDFEVSKDINTWDQITLYGSNKKINGETFAASTTFTQLNHSDIAAGSETVYDDATETTFDRNDDYEMDYTDGEIRAFANGDLDTTETYNIDYEREISGTYPTGGVSNPDKEFVDTVPGIASGRGAEQIAYLLYTEFSDPRYAGTLSIPRADVGFDPLDALTLENLDLPANATPLEVRGDPSITPTGLEIRLGNRGRLEEALSDIASQVRAVSRRI